MAPDIVGLVVSLALLAAAGDQFILSTSRIAGALRVPPTIVGALVGGLGTSIPELVVAALAAGRRSPQLAVGSLVGSIIANVCLALALAAVVAPVRVGSATVRREAPLSVIGVVLFGVLAAGGLSVAKGSSMALAIAPAVGLLLVSARHRDKDALGDEVVELVAKSPHRPRSEAARVLASLGVMLGGAELLVNSTLGISARLGIAQGVAGVTLVGIGTSGPLIASSIQGARRGEHELVAGNVLGGNLFIALCGGALVGLLSPSRARAAALVPLWLMGAVVALSWLAMAKRRGLTRTDGLLLLVAYVAMLPFVSR
ncbi:MAG TPA: hypothetical protein VME20_14335 [Acidimicrobiales bacterium]|nr:hypothetical protein [Acidimicrobiales bacterium]